ncbi:MAG: right-handed parallel beta-helix repeat-containing protein [Planctomycetota bacterium]|jgi:hypothetical protein
MCLSRTLFFVFLFLAAHGAAETIHVPDDYATIQAGIDAAVNGDVVLVAPGTYFENLDFKGKAITVRSSTGVETTVIHGMFEGNVIRFDHDEGRDSCVMGFTIKNGYAAEGAGIYCFKSSPTIMNNVFKNNWALREYPPLSLGGGIYTHKGSPLIANNTFISNEAIHYSWDYGGTAMGAGIYISGGAPEVRNNIIALNRTWTFAGNGDDTHAYGGGIFCENSSPLLVNNTVAENEVNGIYEEGAGIYWKDSSGQIKNSIIWNNIGAEQIHGLPVTSHCCIMGGFPGISNIDEDPCFVDGPHGDCHILYTSPCRNMGSNGAVKDPYDFEGDPRIADGVVDMGAYEFHTHLYYYGWTAPGYTLYLNIVGLPGASPLGIFLGFDVLDPPLPTMWGNFYLVHPWILVTPLGAIPADGVLVLNLEIPDGPDAPSYFPMQAFVKNELSNLSWLVIHY